MYEKFELTESTFVIAFKNVKLPLFTFVAKHLNYNIFQRLGNKNFFKIQIHCVKFSQMVVLINTGQCMYQGEWINTIIQYNSIAFVYRTAIIE